MPRASALIMGLLLAFCAHALAERIEVTALQSPSVIAIAAGAFDMGSDDAEIAAAVSLCSAPPDDESACRPEMFADEQPRHRVYVSAFLIDRMEVSHRDYQHCVERGLCTPPRVASLDPRLGKADHPVAGVTAAEAEAYCRSVLGHLPTEAQWERAARGQGARRFPWGMHWNSRIANHGLSGNRVSGQDGYDYAAPVSAFHAGKSVFGLLNMAGNVWELTADAYVSGCYQQASAVDPRCATSGEEIVIRGGSWRSPAFSMRVTQRARLKRTETRPDVGFRCAYPAR